MKKFLLICAAAVAFASPTLAENARDGGNIGDTVTLAYAYSVILCTDDADALKIYLAGVHARSESLRLESDDMMVALKAEHTARKEAMRTAYSCQSASRLGGDIYTLMDKDLPRDPNGKSALDAVRYTVTRDGKSWMFYNYQFDPTPFKH
jgi:hypothetical protein